MDKIKKILITICVISGGLATFGIVMHLRENNNQNKEEVDIRKKEIDDKKKEDEENEIRKDFAKLQRYCACPPTCLLFTKQKMEIKNENGFEIHIKYYYSPQIDLTEDLNYQVSNDLTGPKNTKRHKILAYKILKEGKLVGIKLVMEIDKK